MVACFNQFLVRFTFLQTPNSQTDETKGRKKSDNEIQMTEMEMAECPVCLQAYDEEEKIIPRVLSCGHSACESCIGKLPLRFQNAIPCPACTQLVPVPNPSQGPSSFPKNIDLLRFCSSSSSSSSNSKSKTKEKEVPTNPTSPSRPGDEFLPRLWTPEFYSLWKGWVLPSDAICSLDCGADGCFAFTAATAISGYPLHFRANQRVSLLPIAFSSSSSPLSEDDHSCFGFSYTARVMEALYRMRDAERAELGLIARASLRQHSGCAVYGVWMDSKDGCVFLVCENFGRDFSRRVSVELKDGLVGKDGGEEKWNSGLKDQMYGFAVLGMGLCEALMDLHAEGIALGCLAPSCFAFDIHGRFGVDLNSVLALGRSVRKIIADTASFVRGSDGSIDSVGFADPLLKSQAFVSPEMFVLLRNKGVVQELCSQNLDGYGWDVWSLACVFVRLLIGEVRFNEELLKGFYFPLLANTKENDNELQRLYSQWVEKVIFILDNLLGAEFEVFVQIISQCLNYEPTSRPHLNDIWRCIRSLLIKPGVDLVDLDISTVEKSANHCLVLGDLTCSQKGKNELQLLNNDDLQKCNDISNNIFGSKFLGCGGDVGLVSRGGVEGDLVKGLQTGSLKSVTLQGHHDCITGLAVGGGFFISSSFDKTVHVWSLQDFSHVQTLRGHEHRVMAIQVLNANNLLCVSGDSGGCIFVWRIGASIGKELLKKWNEHNDWRYSGVHSLAVSGMDYLYSGSGDKSIKAWSMQDYSLVCTMNGHKSVVSSLAVCNGILYSGSWDGTVRLWWLNDHSPLAVLGDESPGNITSVLSLSVDQHMLVASCENGCVKIWKNDVFVSSRQILDGAIFALEKIGKWLFMGGWNKIVDIQEISEDEFEVDMRPMGNIACSSVITALLYWQGKLFVGLSDRVIKVYYC